MTQLALRLKDAGQRSTLANHPEYAKKAAEAIGRLAYYVTEFTAEDVREIAGDPPEPNCLGAALSAAARSGLIVAVGWAGSTRTAARGRPVRKWQAAGVFGP